MNVRVVENVRKANDEVASLNRREFDRQRVFCVNLMGGPGCGKTSWLERTLEGLAGEATVGVLTGDLTTTRDADRIARHTEHVAQINTGRGCHLEAHQVREGLDLLDLEALDLLVLENVGNLICPVAWDLGQHARVAMFSVPEGEDKPAKHPWIVLAADLVLLNKLDLLPYVPFDMEVFRRDLASVRDDVALLEVSAARGDGFDAWLRWLRAGMLRFSLSRAEARA